MTHPLAKTQLAHLSEFVAAQVGWNYPPERWPELERGIRLAAQEFGFDAKRVAACIDWLLTDPLTQTQLEILAGHLTVGETYFFREPKSLEAFQNHILPHLIATRQRDKRLKIWSAGCASGEEPYSIAILLDQLRPPLADWQITILATDINPVGLQRAAAGSYRDWSFRGTPAWVKQAYFRQSSPHSFEVEPRIKRMVQLAELNLAQAVYPSFLNHTQAVDVIFCRNVLMYFTPPVMQAIVDRFFQALVPGGWLIVSPSEATHTLFPAFTVCHLPGAILYQKPEPARVQGRTGVSYGHHFEVEATECLSPLLEPPSPPEPVEGGTRSEGELSVLEPLKGGDTPPNFVRPVSQANASTLAAPPDSALPVSEPAALPQPQAVPSSAEALALARVAANRGQLAEAQAWCEQALATNKLDPSAHYLLATISEAQNQPTKARQALNRVLYLDPDFALAHLALGHLTQRQEGATRAGKHFKNALTLLKRLPPHTTLPEAEGLTTGRLIELIEAML